MSGGGRHGISGTPLPVLPTAGERGIGLRACKQWKTNRCDAGALILVPSMKWLQCGPCGIGQTASVSWN